MKRKNIRDFACIREVIEHIYQYGFFTREDFINKKIVSSPRAYDDIVRQLKDLYFLDEDGPAALEENKYGKYKSYRFRRDIFESAEELLTAPFGLYSVKDGTVARILCCLSLSARGDGTDVAHAELTISDADSLTIRRCLVSLAKAGYIAKKGKWYKLNDVISGLSDRELIQIYYLSEFYAGCGYPRVAAAFLKRSFHRQIVYRGLPEPGRAFIFRNNTYGNILDEEIVYELLRCCSEHVEAELTIPRQEETVKVKAVALRTDTRLGRWYLLTEQKDGPVRKVSRIRRVKQTKDTFDYEKTAREVREELQYNFISGKKRSTPVTVTAKLCFGNSPLRGQFEREIFTGHIEERDGEEYYCAELNDPLEIKPFLRSYGAYLQILPSPEHHLNEELCREYKEMLKQYGVV